MQHDPYEAPWHCESYDRFIDETLPELLASRLPLLSYRANQSGVHACTLTITAGNRQGSATIEVQGVPRPDAAGVFSVEGQRVVVSPVMDTEELDEGEVRCVGEQLGS